MISNDRVRLATVCVLSAVALGASDAGPRDCLDAEKTTASYYNDVNKMFASSWLARRLCQIGAPSFLNWKYETQGFIARCEYLGSLDDRAVEFLFEERDCSVVRRDWVDGDAQNQRTQKRQLRRPCSEAARRLSTSMSSPPLSRVRVDGGTTITSVDGPDWYVEWVDSKGQHFAHEEAREQTERRSEGPAAGCHWLLEQFEQANERR